MHVIATLRTKMGYVLEEDQHGKKVPRKVGMEAIQRDGVEYEFDVYGELDYSHTLHITKSRCSFVADRSYPLPGAEIAADLAQWLTGVPLEKRATQTDPEPPAPPPVVAPPAPEPPPHPLKVVPRQDPREKQRRALFALLREHGLDYEAQVKTCLPTLFDGKSSLTTLTMHEVDVLMEHVRSGHVQQWLDEQHAGAEMEAEA
jgi:hypothetical protein